MKKQVGIVLLYLITGIFASGQTRTIKLDEAIQMGIQNSRQLKLSQQKIEEVLTKVEQARQLTLPSVKWSAGYSHALMLTKKFNLPDAGGQTPKALEFPFDLTLYQSTLSINEPIFAGNQIRYAKQSADLLVKMSRLDSDRDRYDVIYTIIEAYINYYKIRQSQNVAAQNLEDVDNRLTEIRKYEGQGLATRNDVLRFQLQKSNIQLTVFELESNRKIANYSLNILLGLPDSTGLSVEPLSHELDSNTPIDDYLRQALSDRKELGSLDYQNQLDSVNIKKIRDAKLPTVGLGGSLYYINPSKDLIPKSGSFLAPFVIGLNVSWDISSLYKTRQKVQEARIQQQEVATRRDAFTDAIKTEVYADYMKYQQSLQRIGVLEESVVEATENERIMLSKFRNNLATTTDQIDALTILYGQRISLELAKADATLAYYNLLNATGHIQPQTH